MRDLTESTVSSEKLVDGKLLKVYRDEARLPGGGVSVREWIDHPGASAVVPLFPDGSTLLIRQFRYPPRRTFLEVPAGKLDVEGEDPAEVAARELEEETGWIAGRIEPLGSFYPCIGYSNEVIHFFVAEDLRQGETQLGEGELVEPVPLPFAEAVAMARRGEILDMKTAAALFMAEAYVQRRDQEDDQEKASKTPR